MTGAIPPTQDRLHAASGEIESGLLAELTRALLPYLGPYSITTVKRTSRGTRDPDDLVKQISAQIDDSARREQFVASAERILQNFRRTDYRPAAPAVAAAVANPGNAGAAAARPATPITSELTARGEAALAQIIGPLAGVLVQRYARATGNSRDFFDRLAAHLRTPEERRAFFEQIRLGEARGPASH
jgi:hypothetical protein